MTKIFFNFFKKKASRPIYLGFKLTIGTQKGAQKCQNASIQGPPEE